MKTYTGSCHCGNVKFEVTADIKNVISCNCSICFKRGLLLAFVEADQFKLLTDESAQTDYRFHTMKIHHLFCKGCGVEAYGKGNTSDGGQTYAINVRCLEDIDIDTLTVTKFNGKDL
jgi:hypothetical protein